MENTSLPKIESLVKNHKQYFSEQHTKDVQFRIDQLRKLKRSILQHEQEIAKALHDDLKKSYEEAYLTEISIVLSEIDYHLKNIKSWSKTQRISTPMHLLLSSSKLIYEPLG